MFVYIRSASCVRLLSTKRTRMPRLAVAGAKPTRKTAQHRGGQQRRSTPHNLPAQPPRGGGLYPQIAKLVVKHTLAAKVGEYCRLFSATIEAILIVAVIVAPQ